MRGLIIIISLGLISAMGGILAIIDPKLGLLRDTNAIESKEVGGLERLFSYLGGAVLLFVSLLCFWVVLWVLLQ